MAHELHGKKIAILAAGGAERVELELSRGALLGAGPRRNYCQFIPVRSRPGSLTWYPAGTFAVDRLVSNAKPNDYDALLLPGGALNPDALRINTAAVAFVKAFCATGKPVAAICHAPWTMIEADVLRGFLGIWG